VCTGTVVFRVDLDRTVHGSTELRPSTSPRDRFRTWTSWPLHRSADRQRSGRCRPVGQPADRPERRFDADEVFGMAVEHDKAIEINSRPERLDPPKRLLRRAYAFSTPLPAEDLVVWAGTHV
jgi:hypothetical protein